MAALAHAVLSRTLSLVLLGFIAALWRETLNPHPGRPYALRRHSPPSGRSPYPITDEGGANS